MEGPAGRQRWAGAAALPPPLCPEDGTRAPGAGPAVGAGTMGGGRWEPHRAPRVHVTGAGTREGGGGHCSHPAAGLHAAHTAMI